MARDEGDCLLVGLVFRKNEGSEGSNDDGKKALERKLVVKLGMIFPSHFNVSCKCSG